MEAQTQSEIYTKKLLNGIAEMPISELEYFVSEVNALILRKKTADAGSREKTLLSKINKTVLGKNLRERYKILAYKLENDTLTDIEHIEFIRLTTKDEKLRNERVKYLIELAQLRSISLFQLMDNLELIQRKANS